MLAKSFEQKERYGHVLFSGVQSLLGDVQKGSLGCLAAGDEKAAGESHAKHLCLLPAQQARAYSDTAERLEVEVIRPL